MVVYWSPHETWRAALPLVICIAEKIPSPELQNMCSFTTLQCHKIPSKPSIVHPSLPWKSFTSINYQIHQSNAILDILDAINIAIKSSKLPNSIAISSHFRHWKRFSEARRALRIAPGQALGAPRGPKSRSSTSATRGRDATRGLRWWVSDLGIEVVNLWESLKVNSDEWWW